MHIQATWKGFLYNQFAHLTPLQPPQDIGAEQPVISPASSTTCPDKPPLPDLDYKELRSGRRVRKHIVATTKQANAQTKEIESENNVIAKRLFASNGYKSA